MSESLSKKELFNVFEPRVLSVPVPTHHHCYLVDPHGDWIACRDGESLEVQGFVDDAAIWDADGDGYRHAVTGLHVTEATCDFEFTVEHGPEKLPSEYLAELEEQGWVSLTSILPPDVLDGLQQVGCVNAYEDRTPAKAAPLAQHPAVAKATAEPISLWLSREYMHTRDIRLGHPPGVSALPKDDGEREVQGWHTDFPYLWGTGDRIPVPSGDLVLGMQRNICVSDFTKDNGATVFKLGTHASNSPPPREWGITTDTYKPGHRGEFGVPYGGAETDVIEAPAGTIILYDARTWHRAGVNRTEHKRGAVIQAIVPGFIIPFMDTSATFKAFLESEAADQVTERVCKEIDKLMVHKIAGPAGLFAIAVDDELTERVREHVARE
jgi:hypothetical protein